jgi:hypothetical protein
LNSNPPAGQNPYRWLPENAHLLFGTLTAWREAEGGVGLVTPADNEGGRKKREYG